MKRPCGRALMVLFALWSSPTEAQDVFSVHDTALGGRTGLMGGAGIAQGHDEAMLWLNPAGLVAIEDTTLSLSLGAYGLSNARVAGTFRDPATRMAGDWVDDGFSSQLQIIPSSVGVFLGVGPPRGEDGHMVIGAGLIRLADHDFALSSSLRASGLSELIAEESLRQEGRMTAFGLSWAMTIGSGLSVGASLFIVSNEQSFIRQSNYDGFDHRTWDQVGSSESESSQLHSLSLVPSVGARWRSDSFALGLAARAPRLDLASGGSAHLERLSTAGNSGGSAAQHFIREASVVDGFNDLCWSFSAGIALLLENAVIELDGGLYAPMRPNASVRYRVEDLDLRGSETSRSSSELALLVPVELSFNFALGAEVEFGGWSILAGAFTDRSTAAPPDGNPARFDTLVDRYGGSLGIGIGEGALRIHAGVRYTYGAGAYGAVSIQEDPTTLKLTQSDRRADLTEHRVLFLLSGRVDWPSDAEMAPTPEEELQ